VGLGLPRRHAGVAACWRCWASRSPCWRWA
jgi:hypothetical protein